MPNLLPYLAASFSGNVSANILAATGLGAGPRAHPHPDAGHDDFLFHPGSLDPARHVVVVGLSYPAAHHHLHGFIPDLGRAGRDCESTLERSPGRMTDTMNRSGVHGRYGEGSHVLEVRDLRPLRNAPG